MAGMLIAKRRGASKHSQGKRNTTKAASNMATLGKCKIGQGRARATGGLAGQNAKGKVIPLSIHPVVQFLITKGKKATRENIYGRMYSKEKQTIKHSACRIKKCLQQPLCKIRGGKISTVAENFVLAGQGQKDDVKNIPLSGHTNSYEC